MISPIIGKQYDLRHTRKGNFSVLVLDISNDIITGEITKGIAHYVSESNRQQGDLITLNPNSLLCKILRESHESTEK